jgi:hypothetical protein
VRPVFSVMALVVLATSVAIYFWSLTVRGGIAAGIAQWLFALAGLVVAIALGAIAWYRGEGLLAQAAVTGALLSLVYILLNS